MRTLDIFSLNYVFGVHLLFITSPRFKVLNYDLLAFGNITPIFETIFRDPLF